ncbi:MAG: aquaporin [Acidobacteriota bacterium]
MVRNAVYRNAVRRYGVEFVGTFFLVLTIALVVAPGHAGPLAPLAIGTALVGLIFAGGHISGAHYNPAVTIAFRLRRRCSTADMVAYWVAQGLAAAAAAAVAGYLLPAAHGPAVARSTGPLVAAELLFTFLLCWVILNCAIAKGTEGNPFYGLAIGFTVTGGIWAVGPISGAVFNPAVALGLCLMDLTPWGQLGPYVASQVVGALAAVAVFVATAED